MLFLFFKQNKMLAKLNFVSKSLVIIIFSFFSFLLYSCSGNNSGSDKTNESSGTTEKKEATGTTADACSLISEEEAKAILGNAVTKSVSTGDMCQYVSASDELQKAGESVSIQLNLGAGEQFDTYVSNTGTQLNVKIKPVAGIGDKAVFAAGQLLVLKGKDFITVIVGKNMGEEEQIAAEKIIAQKAIERLGVR
jgi:hypothetical protein